MDFISDMLTDIFHSMKYMVKWFLMSLVLGIVCGVVGALFHHAIDYVTELRINEPWLIFMMPLGGMLIVFLYHLVDLHNEPGTNTILNSVRQQERVPRILAPAIFLATIVTHLVGGSSGREGAALQIGGSLATTLGRFLKVDKKSMSILVMCGMTAVFSALFGTPLCATIFSMEVISVGVLYYSALFPCLCSGLVAFYVAKALGCQSVSYTIVNTLQLNGQTFFQLFLLAVVVSIVSILFVSLMHYCHHAFKHYFTNPYLRVVVGSILLIVLVLIFGKDYLGAGMNIVDKAIYESVRPYDFALKALFTAITIGCGFKGGEIVPTFFIGATLGYSLGGLLHLDPHLSSALAMIAMFSCVVNSPIASLVLAIEMFGSQNIIFFALMIAFCYALSGYYSLYHAQKFVYSKTSLEYVNKDSI